MMIIMQLSLYFWNRRNNVSPHEPEGSFGVSGMVLSAIAAPIYLSALVGVLLGKKVHFVVTTKGEHNQTDSIQAFKIHLQWALVLSSALVYGLLHKHHHPAMIIWVAFQLLLCLMPVMLATAVILPSKLKGLALFREKLMSVGESNNV